MPDDKSKRGGADRREVAANEQYEIDYLRKKTGATEAQIRAAIKKVGNNRAAIERALKK